MEIRDPIHGFIQVADYLEPFLALPVLQRLRRIRQTAMTYLVYPGANHTRFEHSLGCMHVASRLARTLKLSDESVIEAVKIAALLHDIGHGPFSHVSEQLFARYADEEIKKESGNDIHEQITVSLIRHDEGVKRLVGKLADKVTELIRKPKLKRSVEHDIVNGPFDADKLDYLLRDSHCVGVKYGIFDLERIVNTAVRISDGQDSYMGVKEDGVWAVEQLVVAKRYMNLQVYRHHTRLITDAMLVRAIEIAMEDNVSGVNELYHFSDTKEFVQQFLKWDDETLIRAILDGNSGASREYMERLLSRRLLKEVYSKYILKFEDALVRDKISRLSLSKLREAEEKIAVVLSRQPGIQTLEPKFVIAGILNIDNPTFRLPGVEIKIDDIIVVLKDNNRQKAADYPGSIIGSAGKEKEIFVKVYTTIDDIGKEDRERVCKEVEAEITEIFVNI